MATERSEAYLESLIAEIRHRATTRAVRTVYLGGGTPSLMSDRQLGRVLAEIRASFSIEHDAEITIEANPDDLGRGRVERLRALGFGRLSMGIQSLVDDELEQLDRIHDAARAREEVAAAVDVPGLSVSVDLMVGTPGQSAESFLRGVTEVIDLGVDHVSIYVLEVDQPSRISREVQAGRAQVLADDQLVDATLEAERRLELSGLLRYEVSSFARRGHESRHNRRYWRRQDYIGLGLAAHSLCGGRRSWNLRGLKAYTAARWTAKWEAGGECPDPEEALVERVFLGFREQRGVPRRLLERLASARPRFLERLEEGIEIGDLRAEDGRIAFTEKGRLRMNLFLSELV